MFFDMAWDAPLKSFVIHSCRAFPRGEESEQNARGPFVKKARTMNTIKTEWNLGNFTVALSAEVDDSQLRYLASKGLLWLGQRQSKVDKTLGGYNGDKRIKGFKRSEVSYTPTLAKGLTADFETLEVEDEISLTPSVVVTEYIRETAEPKYKREKEVAGRHESKGDLEEWLADKVGYTGDTHGEDGEYSTEMLSKLKTFLDAALAKAMRELDAA